MEKQHLPIMKYKKTDLSIFKVKQWQMEVLQKT
jgi:hypothetical protein